MALLLILRLLQLFIQRLNSLGFAFLAWPLAGILTLILVLPFYPGLSAAIAHRRCSIRAFAPLTCLPRMGLPAFVRRYCPSHHPHSYPRTLRRFHPLLLRRHCPSRRPYSHPRILRRSYAVIVATDRLKLANLLDKASISLHASACYRAGLAMVEPRCSSPP